MKVTLRWVLLFLVVGAAPAGGEGRSRAEPVNAVLGDESAKDASTILTEGERIALHLEHVEALLRAKTPTDNQARHKVLDRLRTYRLAGQFPRNHYQDARVPVFVDAEGRRCAVGAIAEPEIGSGEVLRIAETQRLSYVGEIDSPLLLQWAKDTGFSLHELAMIQPTYPGGGSVDVPRDPRPLRQARTRLATTWRSCRAQAYPADVGWGSQRISSTVHFVKGQKKGELLARLKLQSVLLPDARPDPAPSKELVSFLACVQRGFSKKNSYRFGDVSVGERYGISAPNYGGPILRPDNGGLGIGPAAEYLMHELKALRGPHGRDQCSLPRQSNRFRVQVPVKADGQVGPIEVSSRMADKQDAHKEQEARACIAKELARALRFPASAEGGSVAAIGP